MSKKKSREELLKLGNFTIYGVRDVLGHQTMMEVCAVSKNWMIRFDESTFMFGLIKSIICMPLESIETARWLKYLESLIVVEYQFGTSGCPVEVLVELGKSLIGYQEKESKEANQPTEEEEKKTIDDMKRGYEMKEEMKYKLKNKDKDEDN